jgi:hypothetical protein
MALLNQLLSEKDLARMTNDQREFLVERIDNMLHEPEIKNLIAARLQQSVKLVVPDARLLESK